MVVLMFSDSSVASEEKRKKEDFLRAKGIARARFVGGRRWKRPKSRTDDREHWVITPVNTQAVALAPGRQLG